MAKWNKQQLEAIDSVNQNTLVSASAGSGKTSVTIERIIRLIKQGTPVKRIVMLAFSNAVAAELKEKICDSLIKAIKEEDADKEFLREQIDDVPMADISTVHSFCGNLIKEYFETVGVDPSYSILEDEEKESMLGSAIDSVFEYYGENADSLFSTLKFFFGSEKSLRENIKKIQEFLTVQPDRKKWLDEVALTCYEDDGKCRDILENLIKSQIRFICALSDTTAQNVDKTFFSEEICTLQNLAKLCNSTTELCGQEFWESIKLFPQKIEISRKKTQKQFESALAKGQYSDIGILSGEGADFDIYNQYYCPKHAYLKNFAQEQYEKLFYAPYVKKVNSYTSAQWQEYARKAKTVVQKLVEVVQKADDEYKRLKQAENKMDFADLEYYAVKILSDKNVQNEIREKYDYVCIDEYQDTNYVQEFLLQRISNGKNLFMVGDVKQSIYQFRLTDTDIFLDKFNRYAGSIDGEGKLVQLNMNYRSDKAILDFVNDVFSNIMTKENGGVDYKNNSMLTTEVEQIACDDLPAVKIHIIQKSSDTNDCYFPPDGVYSVKLDSEDNYESDVSAEALYIVSQIKEIVGKRKIAYYDGKQMQSRVARYGDITLLASGRNARVKGIIEYLRCMDIPVMSTGLIKNSEVDGVKKLIYLLRCVDNPLQDIAIVAVMSSVFGGFSYTELATIRSRYPKNKFFYQSMKDYVNDCNDKLSEKLRGFNAELDKLRFMSGQMSASELLEFVIARYGFDKYVKARYGQGDFERVTAFVKGLKGKSYAQTLQSLIAYSEESTIICDAGDIPLDEDCVKTSTIHASKGLEYPIVFLVDCGSRFDPRDSISDMILDKDLGIGIKYPEEETRIKKDTLKRLTMSYLLAKKQVDEKMRLFYVALTRPKNILFITGCTDIEKFAKYYKKPSSFLDWISNVCVENPTFMAKYLDLSNIKGEETDNVATAQVCTFKKPLDGLEDKYLSYFNCEYKYKNSTQTGLKHTVTGLNKKEEDSQFDNLTVSWFEEDSAGIGTAYHKILEKIDYDCFSFEDTRLQIQQMFDSGILDLSLKDSINTSIVYDCLKSDIIAKARASQHMREKQFMLNVRACDVTDSDVEDKILIQGTIDLLIKDKATGEYIVVDFKMSKQNPCIIKERYEKQLNLYSMAVEKGLNVKVAKKLIYVLGQNVTIEV